LFTQGRDVCEAVTTDAPNRISNQMSQRRRFDHASMHREQNSHRGRFNVHLLKQHSQLQVIEYVCWRECPCHVEAATDLGRERELSPMLTTMDLYLVGTDKFSRRPGSRWKRFGLRPDYGRPHYLVRIGRSPLEM
jgi:hypothetical protein